MPIFQSTHQRSVPIPPISVGAFLEKQSDNLLVPISRSKRQRGITKSFNSIGISTLLEQQSDNLLMPISRSPHHCSVPMLPSTSGKFLLSLFTLNALENCSRRFQGNFL